MITVDSIWKHIRPPKLRKLQFNIDIPGLFTAYVEIVHAGAGPNHMASVLAGGDEENAPFAEDVHVHLGDTLRIGLQLGEVRR